MATETKTLNVATHKAKGLLVKKHVLTQEEHASLPRETQAVIQPGEVIIYHRDINAEKEQKSP